MCVPAISDGWGGSDLAQTVPWRGRSRGGARVCGSPPQPPLPCAEWTYRGCFVVGGEGRGQQSEQEGEACSPQLRADTFSFLPP